MVNTTLPQWSRVYGEPLLSATLRHKPEDFYVDEVLDFTPCGEGEHVYLHIEKTACTTEEVANRIARFAKVARSAVSFSGMKDKVAMTRQWFSVVVPIKVSLDWLALNSDQITVLSFARHLKKLRRGTHSGNRFKLVLRDCRGDFSALEERLKALSDGGVPNYFAEQRFGIEARNIAAVNSWFSKGCPKIKKYQRGLYISVARSLLFNDLLSERILRGEWSKGLANDVFILKGSHSVFSEAVVSTEIEQRLQLGDLSVAAPLWGNADKAKFFLNAPIVSDDVLDRHSCLVNGLQKIGAKIQGRAITLRPEEFSWEYCPVSTTLSLRFRLPAGSFATAVLREFVNYS